MTLQYCIRTRREDMLPCLLLSRQRQEGGSLEEGMVTSRDHTVFPQKFGVQICLWCFHFLCESAATCFLSDDLGRICDADFTSVFD